MIDLPADLAFAGEAWSHLEDARPLVTKDSALRPHDLAWFLAAAFFAADDDVDADSRETQRDRFQEEALHLATRLLESDDDACRNSLADAVRRELMWLCPTDRDVRDPDPQARRHRDPRRCRWGTVTAPPHPLPLRSAAPPGAEAGRSRDGSPGGARERKEPSPAGRNDPETDTPHAPARPAPGRRARLTQSKETAMPDTAAADPFGPVVFRYTRRQAIEDGVLVDVTDAAREAGFTIPVALSRAAWERLVALPEGYRGFQDESGRLWDVLWMARHHALRAADSDRVTMSVLGPRRPQGPARQRPPAAQALSPSSPSAPATKESPVITIMFPEDD